MNENPDISLDEMASQIRALAVSRGYDIREVTLAWSTEGVEHPLSASVEYWDGRPGAVTLSAPAAYPILSRSPANIETESAPPKSK